MQPTPSQRRRVFRFGAFELDAGEGELRKHGVRLRVQDQPLKILVALLERPGELVAREDLVRTVWPDGVFVDYERGLNAAVTRLRQTLSDSAGQPRYIETLARKGYRFIMPVTVSEEEPGRAVIPPPSKQTAGNRRASMWVWCAIGVAAILLAALGTRSLAPRGARGMLVQLTRGSGLSTDPAVSPDGKLLAFVSDAGGIHLHLWVQQLHGESSAVQLTRDDADDREPSFSPDGTTIVFSSRRDGGGIYTIPVLGGEMARIAPEGRSPSFSPDGKWIAYWTGTENAMDNAIGRTFVVPAKGGAIRRLADDLPSAAYPVWNPDSAHILVFASDVLKFIGMMDWWVISLDGSRSQRTEAFAALQQQGFELGGRAMPRAYQWSGGSVTFTGSLGDAINIWQIAMTERLWRAVGAPRRLTSGTTLEVSPSLTSRSQLIFASLNESSYIGSLPLRSDGRAAGEVEALTDTGSEWGPSISADGRFLAFTGRSRNHLEVVRARDLRTKKERTFAEHAIHPQVSADGSMIAYSKQLPDGRKEVISFDGESPRVIANSAGYVYDWSHDKRRLLGIKLPYDGNIYSFDAQTGKETLFLSKPGFELYQAKFAPDDRSVLVEALQPGPKPVSKLFWAPIKAGTPVPASGWIAVTAGDNWDDKPRWAPDGKLIYFISDRDGYRCLWAQRVNAGSGHLEGAPFNVHHFHGIRRSPLGVGLWHLEIDVATDKVVVGLADWVGNIWSKELQ